MSVGLERSRRLAWLTLAACVAGLALGACADSGPGEQTAGPTTWTTLTTSGGVLVGCQGCHGTAGNLSLASDQYSVLVTNGKMSTEKASLKLIDAVNGKGSSYLYLKMNNGPGISGSVMPPAQLGANEISEVGDWIDAGALEK